MLLLLNKALRRNILFSCAQSISLELFVARGGLRKNFSNFSASKATLTNPNCVTGPASPAAAVLIMTFKWAAGAYYRLAITLFWPCSTHSYADEFVCRSVIPPEKVIDLIIEELARFPAVERLRTTVSTTCYHY